MRRWLAAAALGVATAVVAAGCGGLPEGVDGELAEDWPSFGEPVGFVPDAEVCHEPGYQEVGAMAGYRPVACETAHRSETVHVGTFTGDPADQDVPPEPGSDGLRAAYQECDDQAADYLGANFRHGRLWLGVTVPAEVAWQGGARWFRCEVAELGPDGAEQARTGSLRGALAEDSDLLLGCYAVTDGKDQWINGMTAVKCSEPHQAEFVGVWRGPDGEFLDGDDEKAWDQVHRGCRTRVARYVDVPDDGALIYRTGTIADWMSEDEWAAGNRGFRCYLWLPEEKLTGSLKGKGTETLPVR